MSHTDKANTQKKSFKDYVKQSVQVVTDTTELVVLGLATLGRLDRAVHTAGAGIAGSGAVGFMKFWAMNSSLGTPENPRLPLYTPLSPEQIQSCTDLVATGSAVTASIACAAIVTRAGLKAWRNYQTVRDLEKSHPELVKQSQVSLGYRSPDKPDDSPRGATRRSDMEQSHSDDKNDYPSMSP